MAPPHGETQSPLSQPIAGDVNAELRSIYLDFLSRMSFENSVEACNPASLSQVIAVVTARCSTAIPAAVIRVSSGLSALLYKHHPLDEQVKIAHFTALGVAVDDLAQRLTGEAQDLFQEDLALFQMKMCDPQGYSSAYPGRGDLHVVLEDYIRYLRTDDNPFFPANPRSLTIIVKSCFDFMEGNLLEKQYEKHPLNLVPEMRLFSTYLRNKTGLSESYATFLLMDTSGGVPSPKFETNFYYSNIHPLIPEITEALNYINDVLSFYKELEDGDTAITILIDAKVKKLSPLDSLRSAIDFVVDHRRRVMAIVEASGSPEWKITIQQFYQGYITWHIGGNRYRFKKLLGDWFQGQSSW